MLRMIVHNTQCECRKSVSIYEKWQVDTYRKNISVTFLKLNVAPFCFKKVQPFLRHLSSPKKEKSLTFSLVAFDPKIGRDIEKWNEATTFFCPFFSLFLKNDRTQMKTQHTEESRISDFRSNKLVYNFVTSLNAFTEKCYSPR